MSLSIITKRNNYVSCPVEASKFCKTLFIDWAVDRYR